MRRSTIVVWTFRALWAVGALVAAPAFGAALADHSRPVQLTVLTGLWAGWTVVLAAALVTSTVSLTILRIVVPGFVVAAAWAGLNGASGAEAAVALALAGACAGLAFSATVTTECSQASAYGDESRFPLRTPGALVLGPLELAWVVLAAAMVTGPLLVATERWWLGVPVSIAGWGLAWLLARRIHRLSRRWAVLVPVGFVVHDPIGLADTVMVRRGELGTLQLAPADSEAADLTVGALGPAIEVTFTDLVTVVLAGTPAKPQGTALHARSILVAPLRPGALLAEAQRRNLLRR